MTAVLGNKLSTSTAIDQVWGGSIQLAQDTGIAAPSGGWVTHIGATIKRSAGVDWNQRAVYAIYERLPTGSPGALLATTGSFAIPHDFTQVQMPLVWTDETREGDKPNSLRLSANERIILAILVQLGPGTFTTTQGAFEISALSTPSGAVTHYIIKNEAPFITYATAPSNPFSAQPGTLHGTATTIRKLSLWCVFEDSVAPTVSVVSPTGGATIIDDTPTLVGNFADADLARGDLFDRYTIEVREQGQVDLLWSGPGATFDTIGDEQIANQFQRVYAGPALAGGVIYEWRFAAWDITGEKSAYTAWASFVIDVFGEVNVSTDPAPTGKVDGNSAAINFSARWWNSGDLAADRVEVRIKDQNGTIIKTTGSIIKAIAAASAAPGTPFTVTSAETAFGALVYGRAYTWSIRARASNGEWSPWSADVAFRTNAIPTTPLPVFPANGSNHTSYPLLRAKSADTDADDVPLSGVVWDVRVIRLSTGTAVDVLADGYDTATGEVTYQTDPTTVPVIGENYSWQMRGRDVSAGDFGISGWSTPQTFMMTAGPVVTIDTPTEGQVIASTTPRIDWTSSQEQTAYKVDYYPVVGGVVQGLFYTSGVVQSAVTFFDTPVNILNNHTIYQVVVTSINPSNQQGQSQPRRFNVDFSGVEALADLNVVLVSRVNDVEPTTPRLTWSPTQYPVSQFVSYVVHRHAINTPFIKLPETIIAVITNPQTVTFFDYHAPPGITIEYGVHQQVKIAGSTLDSDHAIATVDVIFHTPTLVSTKNPAGLRVPVMWLPGPGLRFKYKKRRALHQTWGASGQPTSVSAPGGQFTGQARFTIRNDEYGSADEHVAELEALIIAGDQVCLRTERRRMFMDIADYDLQRGDILGTWDVTLALEETFRREAVA